eukprot:TRINITY_DN887_c1_g1_i2.p1 TRINITY_DN887_c1_g1~~TRINITY_DN887_c1_g1_i2.p1  ORF type:complete len:381 (+),score=48.28 TRINITY_DN887_c1_g1_i2:152-1144(+)
MGDFSITQREEEKEQKKAGTLINISFAANLVLTIIKVAVMALSGSIAIFASLLDSILDLVSGSIIFLSNRLQVMKKMEFYKYPVGKRRYETISVLVFSAAMFTATGELLIRSCERIITPDTWSLEFDIISIALVACVIIIKFLLWVVCRKADTPSVQALAQDHLNDVFTNGFGILCGVLGYYFFKLMDPIGGLCLGLFIMGTWLNTGTEIAKRMAGRAADPEILSMLTYLAYHHDVRVSAIDSVRAYYVSNRMIVELDILLPEDMSLKEAHNIGESLQIKLEKLPDIERAYVHLDWEIDHVHADEHPTLTTLKRAHVKPRDSMVSLDDHK